MRKDELSDDKEIEDPDDLSSAGFAGMYRIMRVKKKKIEDGNEKNSLSGKSK